MTESDFWAAEFDNMRNRPGHWVNNEIVRNQIYRSITGTELHWLPWLFLEYFKSIPQFGRVLSIGCGDGAHELEIMKLGKASFLRAFDLSPGAVEIANKRLDEQGYPPGSYQIDVQDASSFQVEGHYDLVLCISAAHHVADLERMMLRARDALKPGAKFVLLEFVGPNRFQWTDKQIGYINRILRQLDSRYLLGGNLTEARRPGFEEIVSMDVSEAVRSEDILPLVTKYFDIELRRDHNGTLMHQLFPSLNDNLSNKGNADFDTIVRLVLLMEQILIEEKIIPSDFVFLVCSAK